MYYGIDWNWSGIAIIGIELPSKGVCTGVGIELELILPELELNCKDGIDPDSVWWVYKFSGTCNRINAFELCHMWGNTKLLTC